MKSIDVLFYGLTICAFLTVAILWYVAYYLVKILRHIEKITRDVADITKDVDQTKNFVKHQLFTGVMRVLSPFFSKQVHGKRKTITGYRTKD